MALYKTGAGNILQPGAQINRLSSFNSEGVYGWPGIVAYELVAYVPISNASGTAANFKSLDLIIPSPDRRTDDRVRDDRTSLVVPGSTAAPSYVYGASISIARDLPAGTVADPAPGFPAAPVTADLRTVNASDILMLGPTSSGNPVGIPATQVNGVNIASAWLTASTNVIAQGSGATSGGGTTGGFLPFVNAIPGAIANTDFANAMMYRVTTATTFRVSTVTAVTSTTPTGGGLFISDADVAAGRKAYILARINYLQAEPAVSWDDIQGFIDFASQVGGDDT
tara:strand:- start:740 stop:1585 length:846 start_codon:yes stop_codon:yes gene_type:complete